MFSTGDASVNRTTCGPSSPMGRHLLLEFHGCDRAVLLDAGRIETILREAAADAGTQVLQTFFHRFDGDGVTGVLVLAESHISIHTWPEHLYAAVDLFTCGAGRPEKALRALQLGFRAKTLEQLLVRRGGGLVVCVDSTQEDLTLHEP